MQAKATWDLDGPQKNAAAVKKKDQGNELYKRGQVFFASRKYEKERHLSPPLSRSTGGHRIVVDMDSANVKALVRRAQAYSAMMNLDLGEQDIMEALDIDSENRKARLEQKKLSKKQVAHRKSGAKVYGNMFERLIKVEEKESKRAGAGTADLPQDP